MKRIVALAIVAVAVSAHAAVRAQTLSRPASPDGSAARRPPAIVLRGRGAEVPACEGCHLQTGHGRPASARLAGLTPEYIATQIESYRKGARGSTGAAPGGRGDMSAIAKALDDREVREVAEYFGAIDARRWVRVVEVQAPASQAPLPIREVMSTEADDGQAPSLGVVAYVPAGAVARGGRLVTTGGGGRTVRCALCHGEDLKGAGRAPRLAGQLPTYIARQLLDMQTGIRHGGGADLMMGTVARLSRDDIVAIAAYTASLEP